MKIAVGDVVYWKSGEYEATEIKDDLLRLVPTDWPNVEVQWARLVSVARAPVKN